MSAPPVATLTELLQRYLANGPHPDAVGIPETRAVRWLSTGHLADCIRCLGLALMESGVGPGDRVALLSENRWEWMVADSAILWAGAASVPIHPGLTPKQVAYILADSGSQVALGSTADLTARLLEARRDAPAVQRVIAFDPPPAADPLVEPLPQALARGRVWGESRPGRLEAARDAVRQDHLASLIYTSGTTGDPKGVMLTHGNFASNVSACCSVFDFQATDVALSFLPLCHVFERTVDYCYYHSGCRVVHVPDLAWVAEAIELARPTVFASVPRLYEKVYARILEHVPDRRRWLFAWAVRAGVDALRLRLGGTRPGGWTAVRKAIADRMVFSRIRNGLGGRLRFVISGAAPLSKELAEFFTAVGIPVLEGYGLTETSPVISTNRIERMRPGTVGPPIPGVEVRIAADGEILTRGPHVMKGYWMSPEKTAEAIDSEGWLKTGDIGQLDADGFLSITDRKKEILVTAQGKNVPPQPIENALKSLPLVAQVAVIGDRRPYLSALIVPDFEALRKREKELGIERLPPEQQIRHPAVLRAIEAGIREIGPRFAHFEQIRRFVLLPEEFTQEKDELTPTLKLKRRVILRRYANEIESMYAGHSVPPGPGGGA